MEVRQQRVHAPELEAGRDEQVGPPRQRPAPRQCLEHTHGRRAHRQNPLGRPDPLPRLRGDLVPLAVQLVLGQILDRDRPERVEPHVQRHPLDVQPREQLRCEVQARGRRRRRALLRGVDRLVPLGVGKRLGDVRRQRRLTRRLALEPQPPAPLAEMLDELDRPQPLPRPKPPRRPREPFPEPVRAEPLEQQHLRLPSARPLQAQARREHARVVDDGERTFRHLLWKLVDAPVVNDTARPVVDQQSRRVAPLERPLRDQFSGKLVVQLGGLHPTRTLPLRAMTEDAIERARERLRDAAEGRPDAAAVDAALERARAQIEELAVTAAQIESTLPARIEGALQDGLREQVKPVGRNLAEIRGLTNQVIRRLERIEGDLLTERHARVDDLALLVDLVSSGWKSVDDRLGSIERSFQTGEGAIVYRIEERKAG